MPARHTSRLHRQPWTIRPAGPSDTPTVRRLANLDSQPELTGPTLIAEVGNEPWAAVELRSGRTVADPFRPSAEIAAFARARADLELAA